MVMPAGVQIVRNSLIEQLEAARAISDATLAIVQPQALYDRPIAERHRIIFYIGHLGHYVMKGGSFRTARCMLRRSFRNWFQPHSPHIYAGFRCVAAS